MRLTLSEIKKKAKEVIPDGIPYTVELEAGTIALITPTPDAFSQKGNALTVKLAKAIRRRIVVRPDPSILAKEEDVMSTVKEVIPEEAGLTNIWIDPALSEVTIECHDPSTAIGAKGANLVELRDRLGWLFRAERSSAIESKTLNNIRRYRRETAAERKELFRKFGSRIYRPKRSSAPWVRLTALGSYREVGRAMHMVTTNESRVLVDCGAKPTNNRSEIQPFFDAPELLPLDNIDAVIITHAHVDHIGMLPVLFKFGYRGPVYCTPPTRDLMALLQQDYIKVSRMEHGDEAPYSIADIEMCIKHVIDIEYGQKIDVAPDMKMTMENAGHILGSSSVYLEIGEDKNLHRLLFSGDIKYEKSLWRGWRK